jgi:hypothetical protein
MLTAQRTSSVCVGGCLGINPTSGSGTAAVIHANGEHLGEYKKPPLPKDGRPVAMCAVEIP